MPFCIKEKQLVEAGYTAIENKFFINYMPEAPDIRSAVYLLGLALSDSDSDNNSCATIAAKLNLTPEEVLDAYRYWEEMGLVTIIGGDAPQIVYLPLNNGTGTLKKIKPAKYSKFSQEMQTVISGRMITVNEYSEYYSFLENTTFSPEALVCVAKYCVEQKGDNISYQYILTVARNQLAQGANTLEAVSDKLVSQQKYDSDLKLVFKALHSRKNIDYADRVAYEKWSKDFGFSQDVIVKVAAKCTEGGMGRLNAKLTEYFGVHAATIEEIDAYEAQKSRYFELARGITKGIGVFYQSLDSVVSECVAPWIQRGYDDETLLEIAKYCFKSGIRTLSGLSSIVDRLYKNGVVTKTALDNYLAQLADIDALIAQILEKCGLNRRVISADRQLFKTWTENWEMSFELICYAAELAAGTQMPLSYMNRTLSNFKREGISTVEQAKSRPAVAATVPKAIIGKDLERRQYTDEQLNALFTALEETDD